jgi:hypothetical protein
MARKKGRAMSPAFFFGPASIVYGRAFEMAASERAALSHCSPNDRRRIGSFSHKILSLTLITCKNCASRFAGVTQRSHLRHQK